MAYSPLGSMAEKRRQKTPAAPKLDDPILSAMGDKYKKTTVQIVLRYLVSLLLIPKPRTLAIFCQEREIQIVAYSPLGTMTEKMRQKTPTAPKLDFSILSAMGDRYKNTTVEIVLRYLVSMLLIPKPRSLTTPFSPPWEKCTRRLLCRLC